MKKKPTRGGARPNAGRKKGTGEGRKAITVSVSLTPDKVAIVDRERGELSRAKWMDKQCFG